MTTPHPPRKGAYTKHVSALHKDQFIRIQAKNSQELELIDQMHTYMKKRTAIEKKSAEEMLKLNTAYLNHKIIPIPDIGNPLGRGASETAEQGTRSNTGQEIKEVNVFTAWRQLLEENEKISKARLAAVQVYIEDVEKDAKALKISKQTQTKKCLERIQTVQKDLQTSVAEVDRTRRTYFEEEGDAINVGAKAKDADEKARGKKKDVASFFQSTKALRKKAGNLSVQQEELDIKSTGARNDYILGLASANAHQEQYFKHDLQDLIKTLESESFEKIKSYIDTIARTELLTCSAVQVAYSNIKHMAACISRGHNYRCYLKAYPSLAEHVTYQQEFVQGDDISVITSSEHDGGYSLIYEARRNASKLNQSFKTAKAYRKRIEACHYHQSKGLKKEPNDTNGPDLTTKIKELQIAIRNAERERAKAESRLEKLREGGINVDEYIDALVYTEEARDKAIAAVSAKDTDRGATNAEWGASDTASNVEQQQDSDEEIDTNAREENQTSVNKVTNGEWAADFSEWGKSGEEQGKEEGQGEEWANWGESGGNENDQTQTLDRQASHDSSSKVQEPPVADESAGFTSGNQWGSFDNKENATTYSSGGVAPEALPTGSLKAIAVYEFLGQNADELTVTETEEVSVLPGECDEEGWLMVMNAAGKKGYVPQNYLEVEGAESAAAIDEVVAASQQQYAVQEYDDGYSSQGNTNWGTNSYGYPPAMETIPEQADTNVSINANEDPDAPPFVPYEAPPHPLMASYEAPRHPLEAQETEEKSSSDEDEYSSSVGDNTESGPPPGLPPPPGPPSFVPPPPPAVIVQESTVSPSKPRGPGRPPSINFAKYKSVSMDSSCASEFPQFCKALYDYEKTGSDEISFEEEDIIRILKREPNGVDDGWWLGEIRAGDNEGARGLFPSIVVEECQENGDSPDESSITSCPSFAPPAFDAPNVPSALLPPEKIMIINPTPLHSSSSEPEVEVESKEDGAIEKQLPKQETVDSIADIPKDMESSIEEPGDSIKSRTDHSDQGKVLGNLESVEEISDINEVEVAIVPLGFVKENNSATEEKSVPDSKLIRLQSANEIQAPSMEVVVTAPTPTVQSPVSSSSEHCHDDESTSNPHTDQEIEMETNNEDKSDSGAQQPPCSSMQSHQVYQPNTTNITLEEVEERLEQHQECVSKEGDDSKESIKSSENWFTAEEDIPVVEEEKPDLTESNASLDKRSSYTDSDADAEPLAAVGLTRPQNENSEDSSTDAHERRLERKSSSDSSDFSLGPRATNPQEIKEIKPVAQDLQNMPQKCSQDSKDEVPDAFISQSTEQESDSSPKVDPHHAPSEARKQQYLEKFQRQSTDIESEGLPSIPSEIKIEETVEPFKRQSTKSSSSESESETSNKKIRRVSSSDDESSSEEAATNQDVDDEDKSSSTDTEVPQPPDELELKQLKRLETMKESPA